MTNTGIRLVARSRARDGETIECDCCKREIQHLAYLSNGAVVGRACAKRMLGVSDANYRAARTVRPRGAAPRDGFASWDENGRLVVAFLRWVGNEPAVLTLRDVVTGEERPAFPRLGLKEHDRGNTESRVTGIACDRGRYTALTLAESASFKTERGAVRWLERRGYGPDGERLRLTA
ncbi:MAG: DUF1391 family protein [Polyangiales bacterium]